MGLQVVAATAGFTRPADTTAYADGDLLANNTTAGSVVPLVFAIPRNSSKPLKVKRVYVSKSTETVANTSFRVHFWTASPTSTNGDNAALRSGTAASYIGYVAIGSFIGMASGSAGWGGAVEGSEPMTISSGATTLSLYALIEAKAAYAPGSEETFAASIEVEQC
jgi:hypothetical protein